MPSANQLTRRRGSAERNGQRWFVPPRDRGAPAPRVIATRTKSTSTKQPTGALTNFPIPRNWIGSRQCSSGKPAGCSPIITSGERSPACERRHYCRGSKGKWRSLAKLPGAYINVLRTHALSLVPPPSPHSGHTARKFGPFGYPHDGQCCSRHVRRCLESSAIMMPGPASQRTAATAP